MMTVITAGFFMVIAFQVSEFSMIFVPVNRTKT